MRILHIDTGRDMRGGQWQLLRLLEALAAAGCEQRVLARTRSPLWKAARAKGFPLARWLPRSGYDIVHAHDARGHALAAVLSARPLVVSRRVAFPVRPGVLSRWKYSRAAHYIAVSEFVKRRLIEAGIDAVRISVVYDGVPVGPERARGRRVVAPATDDPEKGSDLLRAAAALGAFEVRFSTALDRDLEDAAVFVYITRSEGLGSAALLAMAAGVPVVASRTGGLEEVVVHGETGLLTANTPAEIAATVQALRADSVLADRMGRAARRRIVERFSVERMARETLLVYHGLLS
jgi:glycosyltransferase involved in cell wall biosynthesis